MIVLNLIDYVLDRVTMYRLALYYLIAILLVAVGLAWAGMLPYTAGSIIESTAFLLAICVASNVVFSFVFEAPTNIESSYITALILACILSPLFSYHDLPFLGWAALLSMATKYMLAIKNKHVFNPAAIAVALTAYWLHYSATWWVGTQAMLPVVLIGGLLMIRKMRRYDLMLSFFVASVVTVGLFSIAGGHDVLNSLNQLAVRSPLFFFAFIMLTEPLTSPPTAGLQALYGGLVGFLFAPQVHLGNFYFTPELALVAGNVFSYAVSPKIKERLLLKKVSRLAPDILEFDFRPARAFSFQPGQYMEFTLPHKGSDSRGNRRYFTVASSPTEPELKLGVKFYGNGSSFKRSMAELSPGQSLMAGQLAGDFTMPKDASRKLAFVAGGIGVTPFRSMLKYLSDTGERRDVVLMFMNRRPEEVIYKDVFDEAQAKIGLRTAYLFTEAAPIGSDRPLGRISAETIRRDAPDFLERTFYVSGPHAMVAGVERSLLELGVKPTSIKKDFFPGLT